MKSSRRSFLATGLVLPAAGLAIPRPDKPSLPSAAPASPDKLTYRVLGKTGLKVTSVGFGCMITSDASVIERAADAGINYFDTARGYQSGNNERMVGAALKRKRKDVTLATKSAAKTKEEALQELDTSLKTLGTDHVDIWFLHGKNSPAEVTGDLIEAQQVARKAGKIRFAGVSTHLGQKELLPFLARNPNIDVILTAYNFTMEPFMDGVIEEAAQAGKGIVAMKVMAGGARRLQPGDPNLNRLQADGGMLAALKWVLRNSNVGTTIPSMTDMEQLDRNLKATASPFSGADQKILTAQLARIAPLYCRMCGECGGACREGLPVADILRFLTYADGYGQFALGRENFLQLPREQAAVKCGDCRGCTVECPYGVRVSERLIRAQEMFAC